MPIITEVPKPLKASKCAHANVPDVNEYGVGTVWECDGCQRRAKLIEIDGPYGNTLGWQWIPSGSNLRSNNERTVQEIHESGQ